MKNPKAPLVSLTDLLTKVSGKPRRSRGDGAFRGFAY